MDQEPVEREAAVVDEDEAAALAPVRKGVAFVRSAAIKWRTSGERPVFSKHAPSVVPK